MLHVHVKGTPSSWSQIVSSLCQHGIQCVMIQAVMHLEIWQTAERRVDGAGV